MADGYDRFDNEGGGGGSFVMGLLTGTVLGAGLGMLFAPKAGIRAAQPARRAGRQPRQHGLGRLSPGASETAGDWAEKGRDALRQGAATPSIAAPTRRSATSAKRRHAADAATGRRRPTRSSSSGTERTASSSSRTATVNRAGQPARSGRNAAELVAAMTADVRRARRRER